MSCNLMMIHGAPCKLPITLLLPFHLSLCLCALNAGQLKGYSHLCSYMEPDSSRWSKETGHISDFVPTVSHLEPSTALSALSVKYYSYVRPPHLFLIYAQNFSNRICPHVVTLPLSGLAASCALPRSNISVRSAVAVFRVGDSHILLPFHSP
jgi:hypothetical protein